MTTLPTSERFATVEPLADSPVVLRLRPGAAIFDISADELQVSFANYTVSFKSSSVTNGIRSILAALDATGERSELVQRASKTADLTTEFIEYLVEMLLETRCLYKEIGPVLSSRDGSGLLAEFYAYLGEDRTKSLSALAALRPLTVVPREGAADFSDLLRMAGTEAEMALISPGTTCAEALAEVKARMEPVPRLIVCWNFPYRLPFARFLNELSIERGVHILFGACEGVVGRIGPYVIPRNTACLECFSKRLLAHAGSQELRAFEEYRIRYSDSIPAPWPTHPVFQAAVARLFALEISRIALNLPPQTLGGVVEYSYADGSARRHPVFKVPRCEACFEPGPKRIPWNASLPAPVVKDGDQ